ncbi:DUF4278 domain-containing protein [Leptothoe sp. EHU-05/26/07-4]|uniref:DUF4278 domain-containing protein n=1 Tax=Adonisia turfae CCMR0081 TaxID=2292702 RepID=A0A6M0RXF3_9CYAN|nr:DUF4278 domain-containing protein [Adonisia turfae]NEZ60895.1 DUF4278 domain-containing protein [Adonisia turfae CCMR0081]
MKLKYRGVSYDYKAPKVAIADSEEVGKYRGVTFHFHKLVKALSSPVFDLKYRGVSYHTGGSDA